MLPFMACGTKKQDIGHTKTNSMLAYTTDDQLIILECVKQSPNNLSHAFHQASLKINKPERSIMQHYYRKLRKKDPLFAIGNDKGLIVNVKNTPRVVNNEGVLEMVIFAINKLNREERKYLSKLLIDKL